MALGRRSTARSKKTEIHVPREFEYEASLREFFEFFGIPAGEEPCSFTWYQDKITLKTREII